MSSTRDPRSPDLARRAIDLEVANPHAVQRAAAVEAA
jgi:hypothetical protein